jgi:hypothetical protein
MQVRRGASDHGDANGSRLGYRPFVLMLMSVVVNLAVLMFQRFVLVFMRMPLRQMEPKGRYPSKRLRSVA